MNIFGLVERINAGEAIGEIAKEQGVHRTTIQRNIKKAGFIKINDSWVRTDYNEELISESLLEPEAVEPVEPVEPVEESSPEVHPGFTLEEVEGLRAMLKSFQENPSPEKPVEEDESIYTKIGQLHQVEKTRKTIVISSNIANQLDNFCDSKKVNKSDVIYLALKELFERHEDTQK